MITPRPDLAAPSSPAQWHWWGLEIALVAPLAWVGGSWAARRSLGWYPLPTAKVFFVYGWVPVLILGVTLSLFRGALGRHAVGVLLVGLALAAPLVAARYVPGVKQPTQYPIPGRPWLAVVAAPDATPDLYLMKGAPQHIAAFGETPWRETSAALSPDRRHIAVAATRHGSYDLYVMDLDADGHPIGTRLLVDGSGDDSDTAWSPDGRKIAFIVRRGRSSTIDVIGAGGGAPTVLAWNASNPAWSPDGDWIAYSAPHSSNPAGFDIWIMRADGSDPMDVIDATPKDWSPKWSPDGRRISFTGTFRNSWDVYLANADGTGIRNLTPGSPDSDQTYGWSPDGSKILFLSDRSHTGGTFLYFMDTDGSNVRLALRI